MKGSIQELRFLVTQRCTNSCFFCHGEGLQAEKTERMSTEDIGFIFDVARLRFGCEHTTLTGGEPLLCPDIINVAGRLYQNSGKVTLTTNGVLLEDNMKIGSYLERLNISLHSTDPKMYGAITQRPDVFRTVVHGLDKFRQRFPDVEIRLNATLLRGYNSAEGDIDNILRFASKLNASVKFVELYPSSAAEFVSVDEVSSYLLRQGFTPVVSMTRKKDYSNGFIKVGLTKIFCAEANDHDNPSAYCASHNDLFISPDGKIKPCRHNPAEIDILPQVRSRSIGETYQKLLEAFSLLGRNCCLLVPEKELAGSVKCTRV